MVALPIKQAPAQASLTEGPDARAANSIERVRPRASGMTLLRDDRWPVARLIPIASSTGVEAKERNAASALLAVLAHVDEFGRTLLKPLGAPAGKIEAFVETPFKLENAKTIRPDGLIAVTRAGRTWW